MGSAFGSPIQKVNTVGSDLGVFGTRVLEITEYIRLKDYSKQNAKSLMIGSNISQF
jgi:hypothetical protein